LFTLQHRILAIGAQRAALHDLRALQFFTSKPKLVNRQNAFAVRG